MKLTPARAFGTFCSQTQGLGGEDVAKLESLFLLISGSVSPSGEMEMWPPPPGPAGESQNLEDPGLDTCGTKVPEGQLLGGWAGRDESHQTAGARPAGQVDPTYRGSEDQPWRSRSAPLKSALLRGVRVCKAAQPGVPAHMGGGWGEEEEPLPPSSEETLGQSPPVQVCIWGRGCLRNLLPNVSQPLKALSRLRESTLKGE